MLGLMLAGIELALRGVDAAGKPLLPRPRPGRAAARMGALASDGHAHARAPC